MAYGFAANEVTNSSGALSSRIANLTTSMDEVIHKLDAVKEDSCT
jgi:hypothetical protein